MVCPGNSTRSISQRPAVPRHCLSDGARQEGTSPWNVQPQPVSSRLRCTRWSAVLAVCMVLTSAVAASAQTGSVWVDVRDGRGRAVEPLGPGAFQVLEDGQSAEVLDLAPTVRGGGQVVLYFDRALSSGRNLKQAADALSRQSERLTSLGEVEIVLAEDAAESLMRTADPLVLNERLSRMALTETGDRQLLEIRRRTLGEILPGGPGQAPPSAEQVARIVKASIAEELELVRQRQQELLLHVAASELSGRRVLFWVLDGFDLDPVSFYAQHVLPEALREVLRAAGELQPLDATVREHAAALAALGWRVYPLAFEGTTDRVFDFGAVESSDPDGGVTSGAGVTVRPGDLFNRRKDDEEEIPDPELVKPGEPLDLLAEASGGQRILAEGDLRQAVGSVGRLRRLTYRTTLSASADVRPLKVSADGFTVQAPRHAGRGLPELVAQTRLLRLLNGAEADGGLDVAAVLKVEEVVGTGPVFGQLEARLQLQELAVPEGEEEWMTLDDALLRVSVAVRTRGSAPTIRHEIFEAQNLRDRQEWPFRDRLELPGLGGEVAVLIEEMGRGPWGGRRATVVSASEDLAVADLLPSPEVIEILPPEETILSGRVRLETRVLDPGVARVEYLLDDRPAAVAERAPWSARVNLGRTPRRQTLTVIAFDARGEELGRDKAVLNGGAGGLEVEIVSPQTARGTGRVEVEAEVEIPVERSLDRVLFFWNSEPVATLYGAPFKQWVEIPSSRPVGYVRVVVLLDDGTTAEDVLLMNGPENAERVDVNLVELYVVVTDEDGRPVQGLDVDDFEVKEDGNIQSIATFSNASDLPITLGMTIDSSASMFVKLPRVQNAAVSFLHSTFRDNDRAFVVDFDSEPRLARSITGDLARLERSIHSLEADGRTALWESIVFSLVQLQGVRGRKALVVFSDGADEDDNFPFRSLMDLSRRMGVPIYLILMKRQPEREGLSLLTRSFESRVNRLVKATGGRVFYASDYKDGLGAVYDEIENELRSQYLLAYYPKSSDRSAAWRPVDVKVKRKDLTPRTLSGYWQ